MGEHDKLDKVGVDESRRLAQHEAVKDELRSEVQAEIASSADRADRSEQARARLIAERFKQKAMGEVVDTETEIERARDVARISQVVDYLFFLSYGIIGLEIVLELVGARDTNSFKRFIDTVASPLLAPFRGLVAEPSKGQFQFRFSYIVALIVFVLLHLAVNGMLRLFVYKKTGV
ncbi:MAG: YggT family protein [Acidobacteria bacterium]|nr:YggT family protein [Acidobacteriota bacterium]